MERVRLGYREILRAAKPEPHLFARLGDGRKDCPEPSDSIVPVANPGKWPKVHTERYTVFVDSGRVVAVTESPFSCSGDWAINYTHYFDAAGHTTGYERFSGFFNGCSFGAARETTLYVFDNGALISKQYSLTNASGQPQRPDACTFYHHWEYAIYASWAAYAAATGLPEHP